MVHRLLSPVLVVMGMAFASPAWAFDSWPQWRGPNRDRISAEKGLLDHWDKAPPLLWQAQGIGLGHSGVVIDRGIVCAVGERNGRTTVRAFRDKDGKEVWTTEIDKGSCDAFTGTHCTPTMDGERIYAVSQRGILIFL